MVSSYRPLFSIVALFVFVSCPLLSQQTVSPLDKIQQRSDFPGQLPFWIPESLLLDEEGEPSEWLPSSTRLFLNEVMQQPWDGQCFESHHPFPAFNQEGRSTLRQVARDADWIFTARVTALRAGFRQIVPGTMLEIEPLKIFKGPEDRLGRHYVFFPAGEVQVGDWKICHSDASYPALPDLGDELILMVRLSAVNQEGRFLEGDDAMFITLHSNGVTSLPKRFLDDDGLDPQPQTTDLLLLFERISSRKGSHEDAAS